MAFEKFLPITRIALIISCALGWSTAPVMAQDSGSLAGEVRDAGSGRAIAGAQVFLVDTSIGSLTNAEGQVLLLNVPVGEHVIRAEYLGYRRVDQTVQVEAGQTVQVTFDLEETALQLDEIVVTGAGQQTERRKLGNTVAVISVTELENAPTLSFSEILQGREPGVIAMPEGGITGEGARIRIRGSASLSQSNEPIVYVDGVRVDRGGGYHSPYIDTGGGGQPSRLDDIQIASIERVEILKGAAAATLYGTEAANGVIQIFTKKGQSGAPRWTLSSELGASNYDMDAAYDPLSGWTASAEDAARLSSFYEIAIRPYEPYSIPDFYHFGVETGWNTSNNLSVSGGTNSATYFLSGTYGFQDGPFGFTELGPTRDTDRKAQASASIQLLPVEELSIGLTSSFTDRRMEVPQNNNTLYSPIGLINDANPNEGTCGDSNRVSFGICDGPGNPLGSTFFATSREASQIQTQQNVRHYTGSLSTQWNPLSRDAWDLSLDATFGVDFTSEFGSTLVPLGWDVDNFTSNDTEGRRAVANRIQRQLTADVKGIWDWQINSDLTSNIVAGGQAFVNKERIHSSFGEVFPGPGLDVVGAASDQGVFEQILEEVNAGLFFQNQLGYQDFVFATVGGRFDKHSAFGQEAGQAFYPKAGLSIVPSQRPAWESSTFSTLRLRAAVGRSGLQPGAFDKFTTFAPLPSAEGPGLRPDNLGNPDLKPEVSTEWEVGGEAGFFNDRASIDVTYWNREVVDALVARQFPVSGGFINTQLVNIGLLSAKGFDVGIVAYLVDRPSFSLDVFVNGAYLDEVVEDLGGAPSIKVGGSYPRYRNFLAEGYSPGAFLGAQLLDVGAGLVPFDSNGDGQPDTREQYLGYLSEPHDLDDLGLDPLLADEDGDGDPLDHYKGKPIPDWQGAFGIRGSFLGDFRFSTLFEYAYNVHTYNLTYAFREEGSWSRNTPRSARVEATMNNPASTAEQRLEAAMEWATAITGLSPRSGLNVVDRSDYIRLRELSLTYDVPPSLASRLGLETLAVTATGRNLLLWTGYYGVDPEANNAGRGGGYGEIGIGGLESNFLLNVDMYGLPQQRRFAIGFRAGF